MEQGTPSQTPTADEEKQAGNLTSPRHGASIDGLNEGVPQSDKDANVVHWYGEDDPENPLNWSTAKKIIILGNVSFITFLSPLASTVIAPATADIMAEFHSTNTTLGSFITSVYLLGYTFGPLFLAPLSEVYGRSILYNSCNLIFLVFNIACAVAPTMGALIGFRFLAGIAGSCPVTIGAASISDMVALEKRGAAMSGWVLGPLIGPVVGPIIGGYLGQAAGWRWVFWLVAIAGGVICLATLVTMRESSASVILHRKAKRLQKETGKYDLREKSTTNRSPREQFAFAILRPLKMLIFSPIVLTLSIYTAVIYGYMYLCFTTFPIIFEQQYGFSQASSGLAYLGIGVGSFFGLALAGGLSDRTVTRLAARNPGGPKPEYRIPILTIGAFLVPAGLFWYGWSAENKEQYMVPIVGTGLLGGGIVIAVVGTTTYLVDAFTEYSASAVAAATVLRSLLGALLPLAGPEMYSSLGVAWGNSLLAFIAVAMIPIPLLFYRFGERIRNSKFTEIQF